jgi:hypothetical protein
MNSAANRLGNRGKSVAGLSSPPTGVDSSHGNAIDTPAPTRTVRRLTFID